MDRQVPANREAEMAVLGSMLLSNDAADVVLDILSRRDFYWPAHGKVFDAIASLRAAGTPLDLITVTEQLQQAGTLDEVGGAAYIAALANAVPTAANAEYYAGIVRDHAVRRRVITACTEIIQAAYEGGQDVTGMMAAAALDLDRQLGPGEAMTYAEIASKAGDLLEERCRTRQALTGIPTGFADLDDMTSGLQPGEYIVLAARPSMGKSALSRQIGENAAKAGHGVLFVMLEDNPLNMLLRSVASITQMELRALRRGFIPDARWPNISMALGNLTKLPIWVLGPTNVTLGGVRRMARRLKAEANLGLIVVDYLQLMQPLRPRENRYLEVSETSRFLQNLGHELEVPMLVLAQLNRDAEARRRPTKADIKECGDVEQDADVVMLLHREEPSATVAELIIDKQRNGPTGTIKLAYDPAHVSFRSYSPMQAPPARHG